MGISVISCGYMAFKCLDVDKKYSESNLVFYTIFLQFQVLIVGIPILLTLDESSVTSIFLGRVLLIFVFTMTTLIAVVGPKILEVYQENIATLHPVNRQSSQRRRSIGGQGTIISGIKNWSKLFCMNPGSERLDGTHNAVAEEDAEDAVDHPLTKKKRKMWRAL
jgi:hypothetical protein